MRRAFEAWSPQGSSLDIVREADSICAEYAAQGYDLTLRQLYYQFVSRDYLPNNQRSYKRLGSIVDKARLAGLLDWSYIVDRTRNVYRTDGADTSPEEAVRAASQAYSRSFWDDQPEHVEIWVEKEALAGVVQRAAGEVRCHYFSCRGYVSQSEMYAAGMRFARLARQGKRSHIVHLGDHDPSGLDMTRDITDRLFMFAGSGAPEVHRVALNMNQIEEYAPPPNPAKATDARFAGYQEIYGNESWELDALDPSTLNDLILAEARRHIDFGAWADTESREASEQNQLIAISDNWDLILESGLDS